MDSIFNKPAMNGKRKPNKRVQNGELQDVSARIEAVNAQLNRTNDLDKTLALELELSQLEMKLNQAMKKAA